MPSKTDEENSPARADGGAPEKKKTPRRRTTTRTPRTKTAKAAAADSGDNAPAAPTEAAPKPKRETPPPAPEFVFEPQPTHEPPQREPAPEPVRPEPRDEAPPAARDSRPADSSDTASGHAPAPSPAQPAAPAGGQNDWQERGNGRGGDQPRGGGRGQGGDREQGGGEERGGRDFWKRNKRKRGRHGGGGGGHWQPGGGGGHQREQHPPQPPPPSNAPVYGELPNPSRFEDLAALETTANDISSGGGDPIFLNELYALNLADLTAFARNAGVAFEGAPNKKQLLTLVLASAAEKKRPLKDRGYIDVTDRGAFIVHEHVNYRLYPEDPYLPDSLIRLYGLKRGHRVEVQVEAPKPGERCPSVLRVESVMGMPPADISKITPFEELVPYYPLQRILLESEETQKDVSMRAVDILTPVGFGQRALIVAPPKTGKTIMLQKIAQSISANHPDVHLMVLLVDERPEEVTDMRRSIKGDVLASSSDRSSADHLKVAEMTLERAKRLVEQGKDVVILLDSITRLARAYNKEVESSGRTLSGGVDSKALEKPKRIFGAARNCEEGGSLTIIGTALIDTGSRMDEVIFEEFKGTGNMEVTLDRALAEKRIFPAVNIPQSGTRKEEKLFTQKEYEKIRLLRVALSNYKPVEAMEKLLTKINEFRSNDEFLDAV